MKSAAPARSTNPTIPICTTSVPRSVTPKSRLAVYRDLLRRVLAEVNDSETNSEISEGLYLDIQNELEGVSR